MKKRAMFVLTAGLLVLLCAGPLWAQSTSEEGLFTSIAPDAMIVMDLSGSMDWNPPGTTDLYSNSTCSGPFYSSSSGSHTTLCSRYEIARKTLFKILDDNNDGKIDVNDETSLNIRFGLGKFQDTSYSKLRDIGKSYASIYCGSTTSCTVNQSASGSSNVRYWMTSSNVQGATPLVVALQDVKTYLDTHKAADTYKNCRQKFVILVSDGADTRSCSGDGSETQSDMYKRRRGAVMAAKALADAGYKVFVIGMGSSMPDHLKNTLNWMAYYGGTDNPLIANAGDEAAFDPSTVTSCGGTSSNDPGALALTGYAFITSDTTELEAAFRQAISVIREATYSFSQASVASSRLIDENFIYEASFQPINGDPFWLGHMTKYQINTNGTIGAALWDAGEVLQARDPATRSIYTYKSGSLTTFTTSNITSTNLNVADDTRRNEVVGFIRGETTYNKDSWKLGDTFRSNPVTVGTPSAYYRDARDSVGAFAGFRTVNTRSTANGKRIVVSGANDGQLHAFRTDSGAEVWSFIPSNVLGKLKDIAHKAHPTGLNHQYYIDGPISVVDAWVGSGDGKTKAVSDWKTFLIFGEGRGGASSLWSSSTSCDGNFSNVYSSTYYNYCGYYALNITNTYSPEYKWRINPSSAQAPYLGDPWSKMMVSRVLIGGNEKWVGFIGGGNNLSNCTGTGCDTRGKGFFVVDMANGNVLWSYTYADNGSMNFALPGSAAIADTDNDGFVDTAYIGDLGGNIWRFKFCSAEDSSSCSTGNWSGSLLFSRGTGNGAVYDIPSVAKDAEGNVWVYWGTGDKAEPIVVGSNTDRFFAVKDSTRTGTYSLSDLENITSTTYVDNYNKHGWYIGLTGSGEKCLADSSVFAGIVYFTTYTPAGSGGDPCSQAGTAKLYAVSFIEGAGTLTGNARSLTLGMGIPTAPVLSMNPYSSTPDLYVTVSGGAGTGGNTMRGPLDPPSIANRTNIVHWRDRRVSQ